MKSLKALLSILTLAALLSFVPACSSPQKAAFNTVTTVQVSVETAMTGWGDYVKNFHPSDATRAKVRDAYIKYQKAAVAVIDAEQMLETLIGSTNSPAGAVTDAQAKQTAATLAESQALADLVDVIRSFGVKL